MKRIWIVLALATLAFVYAVLVRRSVDKTTVVSAAEQTQTSAVTSSSLKGTHCVTNQVSAKKPVVQPSASNAKQPYKKLIENAPVITRDEVVEPGRIIRKTIYETDFKYPLVLIEETVENNENEEEELIKTVAMVANHVMARFPDNATQADMQQWADKHEFTLLKKLRTTDLWIIQTSETDIGALNRLMATCESSSLVSGKIVAELDYLVHTSGMPNDPMFGMLWGLHNSGQSGGTIDADIDAVEAWDFATGSREILVGVIDSGIDRNHPDLAANMWSNPNEIPDNGIDDDNNGFVDDVYGWDVYNDDNDPMDEYGHGTHCAGTIGAVGDNNIGVVGVNWNVSLVAIQLFSPAGFGSVSDAIDAINYGTGIKVDLTSNSWGGYGYNNMFRDAIATAGSSNILFIASAGNSDRDNDTYLRYPSCYDLDNIISVAASDRYDNRSGFSSYGLVTVDLAAPGSDVYSTIPGGEYRYASGTSMAGPHVAGAAALIKSYHSSLNATEIKQLLIDHVDPLPDFDGKCVSGGRLNLHRALDNIRDPVVVQAPEEAEECDGVLTNSCVVFIPEAYTSNVVITLSSSDPSELLVPSNVVVAAGTTSTVFSVEVLDDTLLDGSKKVKITAYLEGLPSRNATIWIHDTETATLQLTLPSYAFEGGPLFNGAVTVSSPPDEDVHVFLESSDPTEIRPRSVIMPAGQMITVFDMWTYDDNLIDGVQSATITAHVENWSDDSVSMLVYDNENASLNVQLPEAVFEGEGVLTNAGLVSVPGIVTSDLQVVLTSSDTTEIIAPLSVTIPQGGSRVEFDITVVDDTEVDGRQHLNITAISPGFIPAIDTMEVADNELDHFEFGPIGTQYVGVAFPITVTAVNVDSEIIDTYSDVASLDAVGDTGQLSVTPEMLQGFTNGHWGGEVKVNDYDDHVVFIADGGGIQGTSSVFTVLSSQIIISPDALTNTLVVADEFLTQTMMISNAGNSDLEFEIFDSAPSTDRGFIAYYPFDEGAADESGNGHHGTVKYATLTTNRFGIVDSAYRFSSDNSYEFISVPDDSALRLENTSYSISIWFKLDDEAYGYDNLINNRINEAGWGLQTSPLSQGRLTTVIRVGGGAYALTESFVTNQWKHVVVTYDAHTDVLNAYDDGSLYDTYVDVESPSAGATNEMLIGRYFVGEIDDIRIYNRVLSTNEIGTLYAEEKGSLVAHYPFNGNAYDESGNGYTGSVVGATLTTDRFGNANSAYDFDGSGSYIDCGNIIKGFNEYTVSAWVRVESYTHDQYMGPWSQQSDTSQGLNSYRMYTGGSTAQVNFGSIMEQPGILLDSRAHHTIPTSEWRLIMQAYDGYNIKQYDNGVLVNVVSSPNHVFGNPFSFMIGRTASYPGGSAENHFFDGQIDDVRIYSRALSLTEISALYNEGDYGQLAAFYPLNGGAIDTSGNTNHLTIHNNTSFTTDRFDNPDGACHFNGVDQYLSGATLLHRKENSRTCSTWIRAQDYNQYGTILAKGLTPLGTLPYSGFSLEVLSDTRPEDTLRFTIGTDAAGIVGYAEYPLSSLPQNEYVFLTGVYDRGSTSAVIRLYINGAQVASNTVASGDSNSYIPLTIGSPFPPVWAFFRGDIDDVRLFNRALSTTEIMALYDEGDPGSEQSWLSINPRTGTVPAGDNIPIAVKFNALGMAAGNHNSDVLKITSNDIYAPTSAVPVSMWVLPSASVMNAEPEVTPGSSNEVSWSVVKGPVEYLVETSTSPMNAPDQQSGWISRRNHTFEGLSANTLYFYRVKASVLSSIGQLEGNWSDWVQSVQEADLGDSDNDGLPNWWEEIYFGGVSNCNPLLDFDGDGLINLHEYISGMNPTNAWSIFMVDAVDTSIEGGFEIWWDSVAGRVYSVYWKENMTNSFQLLEGDIRHPQNSYIDRAHHSEEAGFYTIDVKLEE